MREGVWLTIRQAQEALASGRLEDAERLLHLPAVQGHRRQLALLARLAQGYAERGERFLRLEDAEGAWRDLLQAEKLAVTRSGERLRQTLTGLGMAELRALLQAGEIGRAEEVVLTLRQRGVRSAELQVLEDALRSWLAAQTLAGRGEFPQAVETLSRARRVMPANPALDEFQGILQQRADGFPTLLGKLLAAADGGRWPEAAELAEQVLALAPQHSEARGVRTRAWQLIGQPTLSYPRPPTEAGEEPASVIAPRFLLWIDGVGGYLICLGARLTFGHASLDARVDVPLVADVSRLHASLSRDTEGYLLEALRPVQVNGQTTTRILLQPGDRVTLGSSCQFLFRLPIGGSTTARLDLVSGHRLPLAVDGVLLLAETLILGSGPNAHVTVPDMKEPIVLFRHKDGLGIRHAAELTINGERTTGRTILGTNTTVVGDDFAFALEPATESM
jgi:tetratricopeptide (TPR) repeat protein